MVRIHLPPADSPSLARIRFRRSRTPASARVSAAGLATGSAETRRVFRYRANRRQYLCRAIFQYSSAMRWIDPSRAELADLKPFAY